MADISGFLAGGPDEVALNVYEACSRRAMREPRRRYLGLSELGKPCERALWLGYNGAARKPLDGRAARIFDCGHVTEDRVIADLRAAGYEIDGQQLEFTDFDGRLKGHCDGIIYGVTSQPHVLEIKSANARNFALMRKGGLHAKPVYETQVHCYMGYSGLKRALFVVENKNTQELFTERIYFNKKIFEAAREKAWRILCATAPPAKHESGAECAFCDFELACDFPPEARHA